MEQLDKFPRTTYVTKSISWGRTDDDGNTVYITGWSNFFLRYNAERCRALWVLRSFAYGTHAEHTVYTDYGGMGWLDRDV